MVPNVSIIFPTFNGWQDTKECLESILKLDYPKEKLEVIVVDNGSTDGTPEAVKEFANTHHLRGGGIPLSGRDTSEVKKERELKIIKSIKNLGFGKAVNLGIKKSSGEYLLITNNDVVFDKDYLILLVNFLEKTPEIGFGGGKVYYKKPKDKIAFPGARFSFWTGLLRPNKNPNVLSETDWVPGCNMLTRQGVLKKIGLFDEKFFFYFEDLDLCLRAKKAGYKVIYYPKAILYHSEGAAIDREDWQRKSQFYYDGKTRILFKHAKRIQLVSSLLFQFLLGLPYQVIILKHQNYPTAFRALLKNIKDFFPRCKGKTTS